MSTDEKTANGKPKGGIGSILKLVATILAVIVFAFTTISNLAMVYIIFGPDDLPKPFYLVYYLPGEEPSFPSVAQSTQNESESHSESNYTTSNNSNEGPTFTYLWEGIEPGSGIILDTGTKIVNLAEPGGRKFIKTNVVLEFAPNDPIYFESEVETESTGGGHLTEEEVISPKAEYEAEFLSEVESKMPVINDAIITLLSTKDFEDVYTAEGKDTLRNEIINAVNARLSGYHVIYVYFTEFVMQ